MTCALPRVRSVFAVLSAAAIVVTAALLASAGMSGRDAPPRLPARPSTLPSASPVLAPDAAQDSGAVALLRRMSRAQAAVSYAGTQFVSTWSRAGTTSSLVQVEHLPGRATAVRVSGTAADPEGTAYTAPDSANEVPELTPAQQLRSLLAAYDVRLDGSEAVAGRSVTRVAAERPTSSTPAARFWIDDETGLLLRREVYDGFGHTTSASAYVDVRIGRSIFVGHLPPVVSRPWPDRVDAGELARWQAAGASCPDRLPAGLMLVGARQADADARALAGIIHLQYTDGLSTVSLFEQRGALDVERLEGHQAQRWAGTTVYVTPTAPQQVTWSAGGVVYTVLADAPDDTVQAVVAALPHEADPADVSGSRVRRGLGRVASWFNPFA